MTARRSVSLSVTASVCLILLVPLLAIWLVNLDIALGSAVEGWSRASEGLPGWILNPAETLSVDLSTVSTLVPVLMFLFPLLMSLKILSEQRRNPDYVYSLDWDPYPSQFPFFLVMLGLTGTLYGLYIGLDVSGVAELGQATASADTIRSTIDRLLDGTATALLSSLVGLIGAFLASRPLTWIFRRLAFIPTREDHQQLSDTLSTLNRDLMELSHSSREFSENLNTDALGGFAECVAEMKDAIVSLNGSISSIADRLSDISNTNYKIMNSLGALSSLEKLEKLDNLARLTAMENELKSIAPAVRESADKVEQLRAEEQVALGDLLSQARAGTERVGELGAGLESVADTLAAMRTDSGGDREALKSALAEYIQK